MCVPAFTLQPQSRRALHARSVVATTAPVLDEGFDPFSHIGANPHSCPPWQLPPVGFQPMGFVPRESAHALLVRPNSGRHWFGVQVYHRPRQTRCFESLDSLTHFVSYHHTVRPQRICISP